MKIEQYWLTIYFVDFAIFLQRKRTMKSMLLYHRNELKTVKLILSKFFLSTENANIYSGKYVSQFTVLQGKQVKYRLKKRITCMITGQLAKTWQCTHL